MTDTSLVNQGRATLKRFAEAISSHSQASLAPLLPLLFRLKGKPYSIADSHFVFEHEYVLKNMPRRQIDKAGRQIAKCLAAGTLVTLASGEERAIEDVVPGDRVVSLGPDLKTRVRRVLGVYDNGVQECSELRTSFSPQPVIQTANHRYRTLNGYTFTEDLKVGDAIACPRQFGEFGTAEQSPDRIKWLGYMLGDGSSVSNNFSFTSECSESITEFCDVLDRTETAYKVRGKADTDAKCVVMTRSSACRSWSVEDGLWGCHAWDKQIPSWVFELTAEQTALFLSRLWATDGSVKTVGAAGSASITFTSTSEDLSRGVWRLLRKLGIFATIDQKEAGYKDKSGEYKRCRDAFCVRVCGRNSWAKFFEVIPAIPGKPAVELPKTAERSNRLVPPETLTEVIQRLADKLGRQHDRSLGSVGLRRTPKYSPSHQKLASYLNHFTQWLDSNDPDLQLLSNVVHGDCEWARVTSVRSAGKRQVYDLEVEEDHNFVVEGLVTHNSTNKASGGILRSAARPYYNLLTVTPLFEQVRKFSSNYVKPFLAECSLPSVASTTGQDNSVLQRSLPNGSNMFYNYASNSADRIRGTPADEMDCIAAGTPVLMTDGRRLPVEQLEPGDQILSCGPAGITSNEVSRTVMQGVRPVWRITLTDGTSLEVSDHEIIATDQGWCHVTDLVAEAADSWDTAGRRVHGQAQQLPSTTVFRPARAAAGGACAAEVRDTQAACTDAAERSDQPRLWSGVAHLCNFDDRALPADLGDVLSRWQEAGEPRVARSDYRRRSGLAVDGRRRSGRTAAQRRVQRRRKPVVGRMADRAGLRRFRVDLEGQILVCQAEPRRVQEDGRVNRRLHHKLNALQDSTHSSPSDDQLRVLWPGVPGAEQSAADGQTGLRRRRLLTLAVPAAEPEIYGSGGQSSGEEPAAARALSSGCGSSTHSAKGSPAQAHGGPGETRCLQRPAPGVAAKASSSRPHRVLDIQSITYAGEKPVYDVLLRENHTLFIGDQSPVLVANCDEVQDFDLDVLPVIQSCLDASDLKIERYSGTPKTFDNALQVYWDSSSQAIWHIPCQHTGCKHENICTVDGDLLQMIGDGKRDPKGGFLRSLLCAKCGKPLNSRLGYFVHLHPERQLTFAGYHMPQVILPMHYESPLSWDKILDTRYNKQEFIFYNECLGESYDSGQKLLTLSDLKQAAVVEYQKPSEFDRGKYVRSALGVDWGGKGKELTTDPEEFVSNTALALAGLRSDGRVEVTWGYTTPYTSDPFQEAGLSIDAARLSGVDVIAHDYGGAGNIRESILTKHGQWPTNKLVPFTYVSMNPDKPIVHYAKASQQGTRDSYSLDKARSLQLLVLLIKSGWVLLPDFDRVKTEMMDFLNIYEEQKSRPGGGDVRLIKRISKQRDDWVHAVNMAVCSCFYLAQRWPDMGRVFNEMKAEDILASDGTRETGRIWLPSDVR